MGRKRTLERWPYTQAPRNWGLHPNYYRKFRRHLALFHRHTREGLIDISPTGRRVFLSELADQRHPDVVIIPRDSPIDVTYEDGNVIGIEQLFFPFSSTDFYANINGDLGEHGVFYELGRCQAFFRLGGITQLGYLIPPIPEEFGQEKDITYMFPQFNHTRWIHSLLTAIPMDIILARNGFSEKERAPQVLTAGGHDIATPAGGDSIKRVDPDGLNEEENFGWVLKHHGLVKPWNEKFGFDLALAQGWVKGQGVFGRLLDVIDKISYTALDCYWLGKIKPGSVRSLCMRHPLIMDVWQDIVFTPDRSNFAFSNPGRLFLFLLLRAYEHKELLFNPYARTFDFRLQKLVQPLYETDVITKEKLLTRNNDWLYEILKQHYPKEIGTIGWHLLKPAELPWKRFETVKAQQKFCAKLGDKVDHIDNISGFSTGLDFLVFHQEGIVPLKQAISQDEVELLEGIAASTQGYYVYYQS